MRPPNGQAQRRPKGLASAALALLLAAGLAGCEPSTSGSQGTATGSRAAGPTAEPTTTKARQAAEAAVLADYDRFWADYVEVSETADYDAPRLAEHATGDALRRLRFQLLTYNDQGLVARGQPVRTRTRVTSLQGRTAKVVECLDSNQWGTHDAKTGKPVGKPSGRNRRVVATLTRTGDIWKVSRLDIGEATCDG